MNYIKHLKFGSLLAAVLLCAGTASAQVGEQFGGTTSLSNLAVSATVQTALKLDITTSTVPGATVTGTAGSGTFSVGLGNVNGLGLGTPATNVTKTAGGGGFTYTTPITLTPSFSGFAGATATITVGQLASDDAASKSAAREGVDAANVAVLPASTSPTSITAAAVNGTAFDRYIGVFVANGNGGVNAAGARLMNLVYTITVP